MTTYYPTLDQFWPPVRARNFVKELGEKPGNYVKNMEILAAHAGVHPKQMWHVNPVTFAERHFRKCLYPTANLEKILGKDTYRRLDYERNSAYISSSAAWAYHKKEPIPPYVGPAVAAPVMPEPVPAPIVPEPKPSDAVIKEGWTTKCKTLTNFLEKINSLPLDGARDSVAIKMFNYIMTLGPFVRKFPKFYESLVNKVHELKTQSISEALHQVLLQTEDFLAHLQEPEPELKQEPEPAQKVEPAQEVEPEPFILDDSLPRYRDASCFSTEKYSAKDQESYKNFLDKVSEYIEGDCWALLVDREVIFNGYKEQTVRQQLEDHIMRDKIVESPHLLFVEMFIKKKDTCVVIYMHGADFKWMVINYSAATESMDVKYLKDKGF